MLQVQVSHTMVSLASKICRPLLYHPSQSRLSGPTIGYPSRSAAFLDRDGTLVEDVGYLTDPAQLVLLPFTVEGIRLLQDQFLIVVVTNQSAVARGLLDEEGLLCIHQKFAEDLQSRGVFLDAVYTCPHHPAYSHPFYGEKCCCRKPQPGMLVRAMKDFDIRLDLSFMVGDKESDILAGQRAGVAATLLVRPHGIEPALTPTVAPTYVARNLYEAAKLIMNHCSTMQLGTSLPVT